ncbi:MAG: hypothetical protein M0R76_08525 [Proteobacteria bacterium]|nr:hypothetical protein [Pseudomonadota bacterium]
MTHHKDLQSAEQENFEKSFAAAGRAVKAAPTSDEAWDRLEEFAETFGAHERIAEIYRETLEEKPAPETMEKVSRRAVDFVEAWLGDSPEAMISLLTRIVEIDDRAQWAFARLTEMLTVAAEWDKLFSLYDHFIARTRDEKRKQALLQEAANIAKDIADRPDTAVGYLLNLHQFDRDNPARVRIIERLLERQGRYADLIALWREQLPVLSAADARETQMRIAECWHRDLQDPRNALATFKEILQESPGWQRACDALQKMLSDESLDAAVRTDVLELLLANYQSTDRTEDVVRVIDEALAFVEDAQKPALLRRAASALVILGRDEDAIAHYATLLRIDPADADAAKQIRVLAARAKRHDLRAEALRAAADATDDDALRVSLLADAAQLYATVLDEPNKAVEIYQGVIQTPEIDADLALSMAHNLNELLATGDDAEARLSVLETIAQLEKTAVVRRTVLQEAARLARKQGLLDRALALWRGLLEIAPGDVEALGAVINLLQETEQWALLAEALLSRAEFAVLPEQRREDWVQAAELYRYQLEDAATAIDIWQKVFAEFGSRSDVVAALDALLTAELRTAELAAVLDKSTSSDFEYLHRMLTRLGDLHRLELANGEAALRYYQQAISLEPRSPEAIAGLKALAESDAEDLSAPALQALVRAFELTDDWQSQLDILELRLRAESSPHRRARILLAASQIRTTQQSDNLGAMEVLGRALALEPEDLALARRVLQIAEAENAYDKAAEVLEVAAEAAQSTPHALLRLRELLADLYETKLEKYAEALVCLEHIVACDPRNIDAVLRRMKLAVITKQWPAAASALVHLTGVRGALRDADLTLLETGAQDTASLAALADALEEALRTAPLPTHILRDLLLRLASWYADGLNDAARAAQAASAAVGCDATNASGLHALATYQRATQSPELVDTLTRLYALSRDNLDWLMEAADVAIDVGIANDERRALFVNLFDEAARLWRSNTPVAGEHSPADCAHYAVTQVAALDLEAEQWESAAAFLALGAALPFDDVRTRFMRRKAAALRAQNGQNAEAISLYREVLSRTPEDFETLENLEALLAQEKHLFELLSVKQRQLELVDDVEIKMALRLEVVKLGTQMEGSDTRVALLRANLKDHPGHEPTVQVLMKVLLDAGMFAEFVAIFTEQAQQMPPGENDALRARLWSESARLLDERLGDARGAIAAYVNAVEIQPTSADFDALARLHQKLGDVPEAVRFLTRKLEKASPEERVGTLLRLARAQLQIERVDEAVASLEQAFSEAPRNAEVRKMLLDRYRALGRHEPLALALERAAEAVSDPKMAAAYAREAAALYFERLNAKERAVPSLERVLAQYPDDADAQTMLPDALLAAERFDEAQEKLEAILAGFGRRRSPQRALVHLRLAHVFRARGELDAALEHLDLASKMDTHNMHILSLLAELAREKGDLEVADRSYRSLLLMARREPAASQGTADIGPAAILFELAWIAEDRGQEDKVADLVESALEALANDDAQAEGVQAKLKQRGDWAQLVRVLQTRLAHLDRPRRRARVYGELAAVHATHLDAPAVAMDMLLKAIAADPSAPSFHDALMEVARTLNRFDEYVALLEQLLEKTRRDMDALARCEILLRLAHVNLEVRDDLDEAWRLFQQAEALGVREVDVMRTGAKLAGASGNEEEQIRLLTALAAMGASESEGDTRSDALFRLAEIHLASEETFSEGLAQFIEAFDESENAERAGRILRRVADKTAVNDDALLGVFERVARRSADNDMLLEFYERKAETAMPHPVELKEGAQLAVNLGHADKAESLMKRMVTAGENHPDAQDAIGWAMLGLARHRFEADDIAGAVKWLMDAADIADAAAVFELGLPLAQDAQESGDKMLATRILERLLQLQPAAQEVWEPLSELHLAAGNVEAFECLVEETMYVLEDVSLRNQLRHKLAVMLLQMENRVDDAVDTLKNILLDEPGHAEGLRLLSEFYENNGREDELMELLQERFEAALSRGKIEEIRTLAEAYGSRLASDDDRIDVYRRTLALSPDDRDIMSLLRDALTGEENLRERIELTERMLRFESGDAAVTLTLQVVDAYREMNDDDGALRALRAGYARAPESEALRASLEAVFRERHDFAGLLALLFDVASSMDDKRQQVMTLGEAADLARDQLGDVQAELRAINEIATLIPVTAELVLRAVEACVRGGLFDEALERLTAALDTEADAENRTQLLLQRADILEGLNRGAEAVSDLEAVAQMDALAVGARLESAYQRLRDEARDAGDPQAERDAVYRLHALYAAADRTDEVRQLLSDWTSENAEDVEAWRILFAVESDEENWPMVVEVCKKLVVLTQGEEQVATGIALAQACEKTGDMEIARRGLEYIFKNNIDGAAIRGALKDVYEKVGAYAELATMLAQDAQAATDDVVRADLFQKAARAYLLAEDEDTAILALEEAMALDDENIEGIALTADIHIRRGELDTADGILDTAIEAQKGRRTPELAILQLKKADICAVRGDRADELEWVEQATQSNRNDGDAASRLADLAEMLEDWELALKALRTISLLKTESPISKAESFFRQGRIAHMQGDDKRAVLYVKKALQEDAEHEAARQWLEQNG